MILEKYILFPTNSSLGFLRICAALIIRYILSYFLISDNFLHLLGLHQYIPTGPDFILL